MLEVILSDVFISIPRISVGEILMKKVIENFSNYTISRNGDVVNIKRDYTLIPRGTGFGNYLTVAIINDNGVRKTKYVHRLLAESFLHNIDNKPVVNHKDGNKRNNSISNLEWCTVSENVQHAYDSGLHHKASSTDSPNTKLTERDVISICQYLMEGTRPIDIAKIKRVSKSVVKNIQNQSCFKNITLNYDLNSTKDYNLLSENTIKWICHQISSGLTDKEVLNISTNNSLTVRKIKSIRDRKSYKRITKNLKF